MNSFRLLSSYRPPWSRVFNFVLAYACPLSCLPLSCCPCLSSPCLSIVAHTFLIGSLVPTSRVPDLPPSGLLTLLLAHFHLSTLAMEGPKEQ